MGQAGAGNHAVGRVLVVERRQDAPFCQQPVIVMRLARAPGIDRLGQRLTRGNGIKRQLAHARRAVHGENGIAVNHAHRARAIGRLELNQPHENTPL